MKVRHIKRRLQRTTRVVPFRVEGYLKAVLAGMTLIKRERFVFSTIKDYWKEQT